MTSSIGMGGASGVGGTRGGGGEPQNITEIIFLVGRQMLDVQERKLAGTIEKVNANLEVQNAINDAIAILGQGIRDAGPDDGVNIDGDAAHKLRDDFESISRAVEGFTPPDPVSENPLRYSLGKDAATDCLADLHRRATTFSSVNEMDMLEMTKCLNLSNAIVQLVKSGLDEATEAYRAASKF